MKFRNQASNKTTSVPSINARNNIDNGIASESLLPVVLGPSYRLRELRSSSAECKPQLAANTNKAQGLSNGNKRLATTCATRALPRRCGRSNNTITNKRKFNILIGVTGSVATIKLVELVQELKSKFPQPYTTKSTGVPTEADIDIRIIMTKNSKHFMPKVDLIKSLNDPSIEIFDDDDEWSTWSKMNDPVLHIDLSMWGDLCLIAPLDANTMGKLANGLCDNLLTCTIRAWNISKPLVYCPAMNTNMYNHPITKEHLCKLQSFRYLRVDCVEKRLACGEFGMGAMASVTTIAKKVVDTLIDPSASKLSIPKPILIQQPTYPIISTSSDDREEVETFELDPSRLLEQTMVTDDSAIMDNDTRTNGNSELSLDCNVPQPTEGITKVDGVSPLFNTSKFLALCFDNERGCFTCAICKRDYKNRKSMARHLKEQHVQGNIYQCKPCGVSYKRREKLIKHYRERHPNTPYPIHCMN